jgi:hypothetical protein
VLCFLTYADGDIVIDCEQISSKGMVKDKRVALESFGNYVEVTEFNLQNHQQIVTLYFCL